jgi:membrane-bound lytic murein transglycosylase D
MRPVSGMCKFFTAVLVLSLSSIPGLAQASSGGQQTGSPKQQTGNSEQPTAGAAAPTPKSAGVPAEGQANPLKPTDLISKAEALYKQGDDAFERGEADNARKLFDQALTIITASGIDIRSDSSLDRYYRALLDRIENRGSAIAQPETSQSEAGEPEKTAPSLLDELSNISEADLATVTTSGVKIYGKYDFEFSVAQPVLEFLSFFVSGRGRSTMESGLQRSGRYREMAEQIFKEEHVPLDLIWLAQAESVWKPNALSHAAARGIWQFVPSTGTRFGLSQTSFVDDRSQPEKSTRAAAKYLHFLHDHFAGDWLLAMAAYNACEGRVDEAIARCGYADFWEIHKRGLLPSETQNYVPIILSIIVVSKNQQRYGFSVRPDSPLAWEPYQVPAQTDLRVVADLCGVGLDTIQEMNPELSHGVSPPGVPYAIKIPKGLKATFAEAYAKLPEDQRVRKVYVPHIESESYGSRYRTQVVAYHARGGDTLAALSRRYGVSVADLARTNRMSPRGTLKKGDAIKIPMKLAAAGRHGYGRYREERASRSYSPRHGYLARETSRERPRRRR